MDPETTHNVFLSCGGEDTRKTFTDHLYVALAQAGIPTFKHDRRQLPIGLNVYSVLRKAIRESKVSVVVFSKGYASSELCLDELVEIVECKEKWGQLIIIPVYYNVDSDDVREQSWAFTDAFARHEECYVDEIVKVDRWRLALRVASKLPGWDLQNFENGYEAKFIQEIVRHVLEKVKITKMHVAKHPVGLEFRVKKIISLLKIGSNDVKTLWQGTKFLGNLKILNISESESLTRTPDFTSIPNLEKLSLLSCPKLVNVDNTIGFLSKLTSLNLGQCNNLKKLPNSICNLRSLQRLSLFLSSKVEQLPEKLGDLKQLKDIDLTGTAIKEIPDSIGFLGNLNKLELSSCKNLRGLPSSICNVGSLEYLSMYECYNLLSLPEDMGNIKFLRMLNAVGTAVEQLPESIGLLSELTDFHLDKCKNLTSLPASTCNLISLEIFNLGYCPRIELGKSAQMWDKSLLNLTRLNLRGCNLSEKDIPHNLGAFSFLDDLILGGNNFCSLPTSLGQLSNVLSLDLCGCKNLKSVQVFPPNLNWLMLKDCSSLEKLTLSALIYLSSINLKNCSSLVEILGLENLYLMRAMHLEGCSSLSTAFTTSLIQGHSGLVHNCAIYFSEMEIPNWFEYQDTGNSSIYFDVPVDFKHDQMEMTVWVDYSFGKLSHARMRFKMNITNITNDDELTYSLWGGHFEAGSWVRHIPPDYPIKGGDKIKVSIDRGAGEANRLENDMSVEKYGVHIAKKKPSRHNTNLASTSTPFKTCKTSAEVYEVL